MSASFSISPRDLWKNLIGTEAAPHLASIVRNWPAKKA